MKLNFRKSYVKKCEGDLYRCGPLKNENVTDLLPEKRIIDIRNQNIIQNAFFKRSSQNE